MLEGNQIIARRVGRIAFAGVLFAGLVYLIAAACRCGTGGLLVLDEPPPPDELHAAEIIILTWLAAAVAGIAASQVAARLRIAYHPERLFAESVIAPTIAIALLLPITLHLPVVVMLGGSEVFDAWVVFSMWITGLAHAVFAACCGQRAYQLVAGLRARSPRSIYVATLVTSCVPFILLYAVPPAIVAITALPLIPLLRAMETGIARERREIADARYPLPHAIVRPPAQA